jgi:perosamine synthetase
MSTNYQPVHWFTSFYAADRDALADDLASAGIQTRLFFCPLHLQPCYHGWADVSMDYPDQQQSAASPWSPANKTLG